VFSRRNFDVHARHRRLLSSGLSETWLKNAEHVLRARTALAVEGIGQEVKQRGAAEVMKWWLFFATDISAVKPPQTVGRPVRESSIGIPKRNTAETSIVIVQGTARRALKYVELQSCMCL
jgi:hypothetical protein